MTPSTAAVRRCILGAFALIGALVNAPTVAATAAPSDLIAKGKYLAQAGDCMACHTAKGGEPFAGGLYLETPFGGIASPNITPDKATGIGTWTDAQFYRVMHDGIGHKGEYLYPAMPFPWYTIVTQDDVAAIKAYLFSLPPVHKEREPNRLHFPVNIRESMLAWRTVFFKAGTFKPDASKSDEINRGAYLVNGLGHCGECHNARPVAGTSAFRKPFAGGVINDWYAPNITSDVRDGIGSWSDDQLATFLKTGAAPGKGVALGPMAETIHSLSALNDADLHAMVAYLKSTPATADKDANAALYQGADARGAQTYLNHCASCHGIEGKGLAGAVPALVGSGAVRSQGPQNVIQVVLGGLEAKKNYGPMPAVGAGMSDEEVAEVTNYVRQLGGNAAPTTAQAGQVAKLRASTDTLLNAGPKTGCPAPDSPAVARLLADSNQHLATQLGQVSEAQMYPQTQQLVASLKKLAPKAARADLINGLTAAYCPIVRDDAQLDANAKALKLGHFSQLVYTAASESRAR